MKIITVEEHFMSKEGNDKFMDENGIDAQIIGYGNNQPMHISADKGAVEICKQANDYLYEGISQYPDRFIWLCNIACR